MTELEKITSVKPATSFERFPTPDTTTFANVVELIISYYQLSPDEIINLKDSFTIQKNKKDTTLKIFKDTILDLIDSIDITSNDKNTSILALQNKKMVRETVLTLFSLLKYYEKPETDDKLKIATLGKLIQSLYDGKNKIR